jgi:hypothetical protein
MFAAVPTDSEGYDESLRAASRAAFESGRRGVIDDVQRSADRWLDDLYTRQAVIPEWAGLTGGVGSTVVDRVRQHQSLRNAISALVLWDVLDEAYLDHLVGPWAALIPGQFE